ncbi:DinB family protein [Spirosoma utsteinense]|uniref:Damage-inducible protein DinB n=1 Tax=Spirosoma utsteinense TaxID=2585773 RepID=A0ABR6WDR3_9BACT|nr:DinB family protein [Spirosoma utsteinense]MBC3786928.1 putative damage-inducible protein DinB [Spirosoma utsteinense]MBC3794308.1 putative damage-inducible protein DinB [Spirosoma utsteinense]
MTTELLANLWRINQATAAGPIQKLTPENYRNRLTADTASAGFIALHTAESMHSFAKLLFGREMSIETRAMGGVSDDGKPIDLALVQTMINEAYGLIADHIRQTPDEQWAEIIKTPFGDTPRMGVLAFLMHHNSYHAGQIAQAVKKGQPSPVFTES